MSDQSLHLNTVTECERLQRPIAFEDYYRWGFALLQLERLEESVAVITRGLQEHPEEPDREELLLYMGEALLRLDRIEEATQSLVLAVEIANEFPEALAFLGDAYRRQGKADHAQKAYEQALDQALPGEEAAIQAAAGLALLDGRAT